MRVQFVSSRALLAGSVICFVFLAVPALAQDTAKVKELQRVISEQQKQLEAQQAQLDAQRDSLQQLQEQMQALIKSVDDEAQAKSQESIKELRSEIDELRAMADEPADAVSKPKVPPRPLAIRHVTPEMADESTFVFRSDDGNFSLGIDGLLIGRYEVNRRKSDRRRDAETDQGFEITGARINFKGELYKDFGYWFRINADSFGTDPVVDAALGYYKPNDDTTIVGGQFPSLLTREQGLGVYQLQFSESSPTNYTFDPFVYKGVMLAHHTPRMVYRVIINDGYRSFANSAFDEASADWAIAGQVSGMVVGDEDDWERFNNFTSRPGSDFAWMLNGGFHVQQGNSRGFGNEDSDDMLLALAESSMEGDGWNLYAAGYYRRTDLDFDARNVWSLDGMKADDYGFVVKGGVWVSKHFELYSGFDITIPDNGRWIENDEFKTLTAGANYYPIPHTDNIKLSFETLYMFDAEATSIVEPNDFSSVRESGSGDQMVFRTSVMIRF